MNESPTTTPPTRRRWIGAIAVTALGGLVFAAVAITASLLGDQPASTGDPGSARNPTVRAPANADNDSAPAPAPVAAESARDNAPPEGPVENDGPDRAAHDDETLDLDPLDPDAPAVVALRAAFDAADFRALATALRAGKWPALAGALAGPDTPVELRRLVLKELVNRVDRLPFGEHEAHIAALATLIADLALTQRDVLAPRGAAETWEPGTIGLWEQLQRASASALVFAPESARTIAEAMAIRLPDIDAPLQREIAELLTALGVESARVSAAIVQTLDSVRDAELRLTLIAALASQPDDDGAYVRLSGLATGAGVPLVERVAATEALSDDTARSLLRQLASSAPGAVSAAALARLADDPERAVGDELLFRQLAREAPDANARAAALAGYSVALAHTLAPEEADSATAALAAFLASTPAVVQRAAATGLQRLADAGVASAGDRVRELATSTRRPESLVVHAVGLLDLNDARNRATLRAAADTNRRRSVRIVALRRLAQSTRPDLVGDVIRHGRSDARAAIRLAALLALANHARRNRTIQARLAEVIALVQDRVQAATSASERQRLRAILGRLLDVRRELAERDS